MAKNNNYQEFRLVGGNWTPHKEWLAPSRRQAMKLARKGDKNGETPPLRKVRAF